MKLTLCVVLVLIVAAAKARDERQLFSSAGLVFPGPRTQPNQQRPVQQREPLVAQQSAKAVQVDNSPFIPVTNNVPNRPVPPQDGPLFRTNQQIPPSRPNQFLNPNLGFAPPQQKQPSFTGAPQQQDRPNPFRDEFQPQQQDRPVPLQERPSAPQVERQVPQLDRPVPQKERPFPQQDRPFPQQDRPFPQQDRPFPQQDRPFPQQDRPFPQQDRPFPQQDRPFPQQDRPFPQQDRPFPQQDRPVIQPGRQVPPPDRQVPPPPFSLSNPNNGSPFGDSTVPTYRPTQPSTTPRPVPVRTTPRPVYQPENDDFFQGEEDVAPPPAPRPQKIRNEARRPEPPAQQKAKYPSDARPPYNKKQQGNGNPDKPKKRTTTTTPAPVVDYEEEEQAEDEYVPDQLTLLLQQTDFTCKGKKDGYYADETLDCGVFHYCQVGDRHSWLCPTGSIFHQVHLICMPVSDDNICKKSSQFHFVNDYLYKAVDDGRDNSTGVIYADRYYPDGYEHGVPYDMEKVEAPKKHEYKAYNQAVVPTKKPIYREHQRRPPQQYQSQPQYTQPRQNFQDEEVERQSQVLPEVREEEPAQRRQSSEPESKPEEVKEAKETSQEGEQVEAEEKSAGEETDDSLSVRRVIRPALTSSEEVISS